MNSHLQHGPSRTVVALLVLLLAAPALLRASGPAVAPDPDDPVRLAADFRARAMTLVESTGDLTAAARFLVETASELDVASPARAVNLRLAGRYYHHAGELDAAYGSMLLAARTAYTARSFVLAADALVDAGLIAAEQGKDGAARRAADKAGFVLRTEDLPVAERLRILGRVVYLDAPGNEPALAADGGGAKGRKGQ